MKAIKWCFVLLCMCVLMVACHYPEPDYSRWNLTKEQRDSLEFRATHHYGTNYNFKVLADSLPLRQMLNPDSLWIYKDDILVVADYAQMSSDTTDTIWIKVARDQSTMGWIAEDRLLEHAVPVDPISQFIHWFSNLRNLFFLIIGGAFVLFYLYRRAKRKAFHTIREQRIDSIYPILFCLAVVFSATLYASMQRFVPETWEHYYYNPSLNPFALPFVLGLFIASVWFIILLALALVDDLFHQVDFSTGFFSLLGLGTLCMFFYLLVTWSVYYYIGYLLVAAFSYWAVSRLVRTYFNAYCCGNCGKRLLRKGVCPHCGYLNE